MTSQYIINFEHVELMKVTSDTTIYVRFASGSGEVIEFKNADDVKFMSGAFIAWCDGESPYRAYIIGKELKND
jgi:hypothetical protein